jgi:uncharacterized protein YndB with AHSA1/START domain
MAARNPVEKLTKEGLVLTRVLSAPRGLVFKAWTDPKQVAQWWGPRGFTNPVCELDVRPGGALRIDMRAPDGTVYPMTGVYQEIVEPERLVFTSSALDPARKPLFEVLTTVAFSEKSGKTTVTVRARVVKKFTTGAAPYLEGMEEGWTQTLERLEEHVSKGSGSKAQTGAHAPAGTSSDREIVLTRVLDAPPAVVFAAWTDGRHIGRWWGPRGFTTTVHEMDVRPGGVARYLMHGPDGVDYPNRIDYIEVQKPDRLLYDHGSDDRNDPERFRVTVTFAAQGGKTKLTLRSVFLSKKVRDDKIEFGAVQGGNETLDRLGEYLATK